MEILKTIWCWFDGKKTAIGALLLFLAGAPHLENHIGPNVIDVVYYIGTGLAGIGIGHKFKKGK